MSAGTYRQTESEQLPSESVVVEIPDPPNRGRAWSQEVEVDATSLRVRLQAIEARHRDSGEPVDTESEAIYRGVEELLQKSELAARGRYPKHRVLLSWWRGTCIEAAFQNIHRAEAELARLYDDDEVHAEVPDAVARAEIGLNREDPMREAARWLCAMPAGRAKRILLSKVIQVGHEAADRSHTRVRNFRNVVLVTALFIAVLVVVFAAFVATNPTGVPLCFEPAGLPTACPTGDEQGRTATGLDVVVVAMLGLLGGSLSAAVSIRNLRGTCTPYDVPIALALLKVPAGALTALGALIAIRGQFIPGLSALDSQEQILAYALVFGYAQQLLTGLIDRKALDLLQAVPSKDAEQSRPPLQPHLEAAPAPATPAPVATASSPPATPATGAPARWRTRVKGAVAALAGVTGPART